MHVKKILIRIHNSYSGLSNKRTCDEGDEDFKCLFESKHFFHEQCNVSNIVFTFTEPNTYPTY